MREKSKEFLEQCMKDSGFSNDEIDSIMEYIQNAKKEELKKILKKSDVIYWIKYTVTKN